MLILNKDDIEFVTEFPCLLGHPVSENAKRTLATNSSFLNSIFLQADGDNLISLLESSIFEYFLFLCYWFGTSFLVYTTTLIGLMTLYPFIFATLYCRMLLDQIVWNIKGLQHHISKIGFRKFELVAKTQFLLIVKYTVEFIV